ncbi:MAG: HAD-IB family hydrolase [Variovorax paradoxus]|nr:MAG: HAD-IB family hydrolase [Variovorax paradoxus]PZQ06741.1 MAG: HAD-IB family hydrolase [Variovorax paradoxus]
MNLALFDLDHTLLQIDSDHAWGVYTTRIGWTDPEAFVRRNDAFYAHYKAGTLDIHDYVRFATDAVRERGPQAAAAAHADFMREMVLPALLPAARELVELHRARGDTLLLVTATNEFVTAPIAQALGIEHLIAVQLERAPLPDGGDWITGAIRGVPSAREGKVTRMQAWLDERGLTWDSVHCTFYSDSINDLPLLEKVQVPVATNPDDRLRAVAQARGWRILDLFEKLT